MTSVVRIKLYMPVTYGYPGRSRRWGSFHLSFLGLDYSQKDLYADSEGKKANYPHCYRRFEEKLAKLSRMEKGSWNYRKQLKKIRKQHNWIANQRKDFLQKQSTRLAAEYDVVVVEDVNLLIEYAFCVFYKQAVGSSQNIAQRKPPSLDVRRNWDFLKLEKQIKYGIKKKDLKNR